MGKIYQKKIFIKSWVGEASLSITQKANTLEEKIRRVDRSSVRMGRYPQSKTTGHTQKRQASSSE